MSTITGGYDWLDSPLPQPEQFAASLAEYKQPPRRDWILYLLIAVLIGVILWLRWPAGGDSDDRGSVVSVDSVHLLILEESEERRDLNADQLAIFNALPIRRAIDERDGAMRVIDRDDIPSLTSPWRELAELVSDKKLPVGLVAKGKKAIPFPLKDVETVVEKIESIEPNRK